MLEGSSLQFKPCYVKRTEIVHDLTGRLTKRLRKSDLPSVYAELSGERTSPGEPWVINKVHLLGETRLRVITNYLTMFFVRQEINPVDSRYSR